MHGFEFFVLCLVIVFMRFISICLVPDSWLTPAGIKMRGRMLKWMGEEENLPPVWFRNKK